MKRMISQSDAICLPEPSQSDSFSSLSVPILFICGWISSEAGAVLGPFSLMSGPAFQGSACGNSECRQTLALWIGIALESRLAGLAGAS